MPKRFLFALFLLFIASCTTAQVQNQNSKISSKDSPQDVRSAVGAVAGAITGKNVEAKYCPVCGRHYSAKVEACPIDGTKLREIAP